MNIHEISTAEEKLRNEPENITDDVLFRIKTDDLNYIENEIEDTNIKKVLTRKCDTDTLPNDEFNKVFSQKTHDIISYVSWDIHVISV